jgi:hypothetical protein
MTIRQSKQSLSRVPALSTPEASDVVPLIFEYVCTTLANMALNDIIEMGALPANCVPVAPPILVCDDIDTGTTLTLSLGIMSGDYLGGQLDSAGAARTCGAEFLNASTVGQAGGMVTSALPGGLQLSPTLYDRAIGVKIAAAATGVTAGAKIRVMMLVAPAPVGI